MQNKPITNSIILNIVLLPLCVVLLVVCIALALSVNDLQNRTKLRELAPISAANPPPTTPL